MGAGSAADRRGLGRRQGPVLESRTGGNVVRTFAGPADYVFAVATSADGKVVAAGGADGVLFLWNGDDGKVIRKLDPGLGTLSLAKRPGIGKRR